MISVSTMNATFHAATSRWPAWNTTSDSMPAMQLRAASE